LEFFHRYLLKSHIGFIEGYDQDYFTAVFRNHDQDNSGFLDFREFACCLSMLLRGDLRDRLGTLAENLQDEKGYLDARQFSDKLNQLLAVIRKAVEYD